MEAPTIGVVVDRLRGLTYTIVSVTPASAAGVFDLLRLEMPSFSTIKAEDYVIYAHQLSAMLGSGIALSSAFDVLAEQTENRKLKIATQKVSAEIKAGMSLADALRKHPAVFSNLFINMVAAGEVAGNLDEVLLRLAGFLEKAADFQQKVITALLYPLTLLFFSIAVVIFVTLTILPTFVKMFKESNVPLPLPTQILYSFNLILRQSWPLFLLLALLLPFLLRYLRKSSAGKAFFDRLSLDLPVWGPLARKVEIARFLRTLSALLASGVPMLHSLETLARTTENSIFSAIAREAYENVSKGGNLSEQLKVSGEFPPMPVKMAAVGEETGTLDKMLAKVADFYETSVDYAVKRLTSLIEPIFLILVGGMVGFIVASVVLPIFNMVSTLRK
jgi:type IV pilus assembly protein PilC